MKKRHILMIVFGLVAAAINVLIIVESAMDGNASSSQSLGFTKAFIDIINKIFVDTPITQDQDLLHAVVRKLFGHFLLFGLSGIFTTLTFGMIDDFDKRKLQLIVFSLAFGLTIATISESIQFFTPGRAGVISDILIDFSGYLLFTLITFVVLFLIDKNIVNTKKRN